MIFKSEKETNKNITRTNHVVIELETFGTEAQKNITIKHLVDELLVKGFNVKLKSFKTIKKN